MNTLTIRTLGLPWLVALALTAMALLALAGQETLPNGAWRVWDSAVMHPEASQVSASQGSVGLGLLPASKNALTNGSAGKSNAALSPVELLNALTSTEHVTLRDQLVAVRALLSPQTGDPDMVAISQARARLSALVAAQDQPVTMAPSAVVLTTMLSRIDAEMSNLHQSPATLTPAVTSDDTLLKAALLLALFGAVLALIAGPVALAPVQLLCASMADAALDVVQSVGTNHSRIGKLWGLDRPDTWGLLARHAANLLNTAPTQRLATLSEPTEELRQTAEAMSRLLMDSGQELARMRGEAGEAVNNAVMLGARLADAVLDAEARLEASVQRVQTGRSREAGAGQDSSLQQQGGCIDTAALWSAASAHADRLEEAATRALAAATVLPTAAERIEKAISGLDRMSITVAANSDGLADLAARAGAAAAMLPEAAHRIEQAASGLDGVTSRTSSAAAMLPQAAQLIAQASAELGRAAEAVANNATGLNDAVARQAETAASLPHVVRRIETAVAGLDRTAVALDDATDHARIANRAASATASVNETTQRALADAAQQIASLSSSLCEQLPVLASQIAHATDDLRGGASTMLQAADRVEGSSRAIATLSSGVEAAQTAMSGATFRMSAISDQLPAIALQIANTTSELDRSAQAVTRAAERADDSSRVVGALTAGVESAQVALSSAIQRVTSVGEELPSLAFQIADATQGLDRNLERLGVAVDNNMSALHEAATAVGESATMQSTMIGSLSELVAQTQQGIPALVGRIEEAVGKLDDQTATHQQSLIFQALRIEAVSEALEHRAGGLSEVADRLAGSAANSAHARETMDAHQATLETAARQIVEVTSVFGDSFPPIASRINDVITTLEDSANSLSMIGNSAGEALPAAASRIDEALAGLDSTVQLISEAARAAAASVAESSGTQSALAQTVQCMASVGEALPSLAMRLEGTLGALDRSTDTIVAAANDVAEAGRAITATATGVGGEDGERRPSFGPPRPVVPDATMRRLQSVASALAMAGNAGRG